MGIGALVLLMLIVVLAFSGIGFLLTRNKAESNRGPVIFKVGPAEIRTSDAGIALVAMAVVLAVVLVQSGLLSASGTASAGTPGTTPGGGTLPTNTVPIPATATSGVSFPTITVSVGTSDVSSQVLAAFNNFCQALHANQLDSAFNDLTPTYQQTVGSPSNVPNAVGGKDLDLQETASDCSEFFPPSVKPSNQDAVELGNVVVTDSAFGTRTIARNFELVLINGNWLISNIYAQ